ncbi:MULTISPECIES: helix-turn-helix domain-containing protein [Paraburkholderia]|uniref:helix-turn-helix domain-containing protein n=1 Tax=Paraburkholderia TaxID=1822464 RepID=UPI0022503ACA|nr:MULTISPECIES: helix-turn-helix transcriptional regulator [Paraburkholderia]MCX4177858.1 helix-turn-helix transcriptional regulator [Paraburkholderia madseniana]MDQ6465845.1 helix-turn-helix domain-containing protein [Paraburkholderia madseniana]
MRSDATLGKALKQLREIANVTQEDFGLVSSRTYISTVERGLKSPTLGKIEQFAEVLGVHPLTLLTVAYMDRLTPKEIERTTALLRDRLLTIVSEK